MMGEMADWLIENMCIPPDDTMEEEMGAVTNPTREEVERLRRLVRKENTLANESVTLQALLDENERLSNIISNHGCPWEFDDEKCLAHQREAATEIERQAAEIGRLNEQGSLLAAATMRAEATAKRQAAVVDAAGEAHKMLTRVPYWVLKTYTGDAQRILAEALAKLDGGNDA